MIDGVSSSPFSATTMPPIKEPEISHRLEVIDMSRQQFALNKLEVEKKVLDWHNSDSLNNKKASTLSSKKDSTREKPPIKKEEMIKEFVPKLDLTPDDDFVSLQDIKIKKTESNHQNQNNKKVVNEKSLSELRAVLSKIKKDKDSNPIDLNSESLQEESLKETKSDNPKEIPEDRLRNLLQID